MTRSEYQELVEFIAPRFDRIAVRFDAVDERFDGIDERLRRVEILGEENRHQIQIVAEAVAKTVSIDKFEAFRSEMATGFQNIHELLRASHLGLDPPPERRST